MTGDIEWLDIPFPQTLRSTISFLAPFDHMRNENQQNELERRKQQNASDQEDEHWAEGYSPFAGILLAAENGFY